MHLRSPRFEVHSCTNTTVANQSLLDHTPRHTSQDLISSPYTQARLAPNVSDLPDTANIIHTHLSTLQTQGLTYRSACMRTVHASPDHLHSPPFKLSHAHVSCAPNSKSYIVLHKPQSTTIPAHALLSHLNSAHPTPLPCTSPCTHHPKLPLNHIHKPPPPLLTAQPVDSGPVHPPPYSTRTSCLATQPPPRAHARAWSTQRAGCRRVACEG